LGGKDWQTERDSKTFWTVPVNTGQPRFLDKTAAFASLGDDHIMPNTTPYLPVGDQLSDKKNSAVPGEM
jgi:hypothetical protein